MSRRALMFRAMCVPLTCVALLAAGCAQPDLQVTSLTATATADDWIVFEYEIENTAPGEKTVQRGAVAKGPDASWFFKFTGPVETVRDQRSSFESLLRSLTIP